MLKAISVLTVLAGVFSQATAAITVSDFTLTSTSLSFDISGTLPSETPEASRSVLLLVNHNPNGNAFNAIANTPNSSGSFSGSQTLNGSQTGNTNHGDYLIIVFHEMLTPDAGLVGKLTLAWDAEVFNPSMIHTVELYWGTSLTDATTSSGIYLTSVPEPSTYAAIAGTAILALVLVRRLRRKA